MEKILIKKIKEEKKNFKKRLERVNGGKYRSRRMDIRDSKKEFSSDHQSGSGLNCACAEWYFAYFSTSSFKVANRHNPTLNQCMV
jgi:hypothetical protein